MISPDRIPTFTGDLIGLQQHIAAMRRAAKAIRDNGSDVHTRFQGLSAFYRAPEASDLFVTTQAVEDKSSSFATELDTVADALSDYVVEAAEVVRRLESLRAQAQVFVESVKDDDGLMRNWQQDQDKVDQHQAIWDGVNAAVAAFQLAEVACADKITALVGGTQWHIDDGSPEQDNAYGFTAEQLGEADRLPWGTPAHHEALPFGVDHHLRQAGISLWDNAVGSVEGLVDLFSPGEEGSAAREGLARVVMGLESFLLDPHGDRTDKGPWNLPVAKESRPVAKEFAKGMVAWDDWKTNPGKAAGTVLFNALTLGSGPLGATAKGLSAGGRAGTGARALGTVARVGEVLDPIGAAARTVGVASRTLPRVSELTAGVRAATDAAATADAAHSTLRLADGSEVRIESGEFLPGRNGVADETPAPREPSAAERPPTIESPRDFELVGAGARTGEVSAHAGDGPSAGVGRDAAGGRDAALSTHHGQAGEVTQEGRHASGPDSHSASGSDHPVSGHGDSGSEDALPGAHGSDGAGSSGDGGGQAPGQAESGPMRLGGETEQRLREAIRNIPRNTMKPKVVERVVARLGEHPFGSEIAEIISSGRFSQSPGFRNLVSTLGSGNPHPVPRAVDQIRLGEQFYRSGLRDIAFEQKDAAIKADVDVRVVDEASESWGYQLKRLDNPKDPFESITKADYLGQLSKSDIDHRIMLVDGQGTVAEWQARGIPEELLQVHRGEHPVKSDKGQGILFVIRLEDGTIVIPPGSKVDPRGVL
ncbi:hypothetical protein AB0M97_19295 [Streptomyces sp. NPDC051207]|uniref:hypothetical protein n=1 Tax=Streptomyces sp. NPDC051207 TaxID=3154641 RepID=UPI00342D309C